MAFKLSVAIITYNEENNLDRCLESVKGISDEIVVVDSGSTDRTKEIAQKHGARVFTKEFQGHIEQKNFTLDQCQNDMVLSLDADEALSKELSASIEKEKNSTEKEAYQMNRLTNYRGSWIKHCGWVPG